MFATTVAACARSHAPSIIGPRLRPPRGPPVAIIHHDDPSASGSEQRLIRASTSAYRWIKDSADTRAVSGDGPRSVHSTGTVMCTPLPASSTNMRVPPRFIEYTTSTSRPASGWKGWVTVREPKC
jgi:hypothetical protein